MLSVILFGLFAFTRLLLTSFRREEQRNTEIAQSRDFAEAILNSVSSHIAIVDRNGIIRRTNSAWQKFALANGYAGDPTFVGTSYIAPLTEIDDGLRCAEGIRDVIEQKSDMFEMEYSCDSGTVRSWFNMRVNPLQSEEGAAVIVHENVSRIKLVEEKFRKLASHDALTGMNNRRALLETGDVEFNRARRYGHSLSAIMIDCDHFKKVNDSFGHDVGDSVLINFATTIATAVREADHVGRLGGEEFLIILPHADIKGACELAERVRKAIESTPTGTGTKQIWCTASLGVAEISSQTHTFADLIKLADQAMYAAKGNGRNRVEMSSAACGVS